MASELTEFYIKLVPQCRQLAKRGTYWYLTWTCKLTGRPCGPKECPDHPDLKDLIKSPAPEEPFQQAAELVVGTPGSTSLLADKSRPGEVASNEELSIPTPDLPDLKPASEALPSTQVQIRKNTKSHSRPHCQPGTAIKRILITFREREGGGVRRYAFDCVTMQTRKKPLIVEFPRKSARFYFPPAADDEEIRSVVAAWFEKLGVHNSETKINLMGSPESFSIAILDED